MFRLFQERPGFTAVTSSFQRRIGGHEWLLCPGSKGRPSSHVAHKLPRDSGRVSSSDTLRSRPNGTSCACPHRQHIGGLLHQSAGGSVFMPLVQAGTPDPSVGSGEAPLTKSSVYSWVSQSGGRHPVEAGAETWRVHPEVVELLWKEFGQAEVDLFELQETTNCPLWFSLTHPAPLSLDAMVQTWPRLHLYAFPQIVLLPGVLERVSRDGARLLLVAPFWPAQVWFSDLVSLLNGSPLEIPIGGTSSLRWGAPFFIPARSCGSCGHGP